MVRSSMLAPLYVVCPYLAGAQLLDAGIDTVVCWDSLVADEAACWFSLGFARALAASDDVAGAFGAGVAAILSVTEPGRLDNGAHGWLQKFELGDPRQVVSRANLMHGRRERRHGGRLVAGMPWLLQRKPTLPLIRLPPSRKGGLCRLAIERQLVAALHRIKMMAAMATPQSSGGASAFISPHCARWSGWHWQDLPRRMACTRRTHPICCP